ncbi:hypothetical protein ADUPG1_006514, partial [Aduncisulcus paluster]
KTVIGAKEVEFLGFMISGEGIRRSPKKLAAIKKFKKLKSVSDVRSFLGTANYLKKFIPNYAEKVKPLTAMTGKHAVFQWNSEAKKAMDTVIKDLESGLCLEFPRADAELHLYTDASLCGIGGMLSYSIICDPSAAKNLTYALQKAGHLLQEKNPAYNPTNYFSFFREIRKAAQRRLNQQESKKGVSGEFVRKQYTMIQLKLTNACKRDHIQDDELISHELVSFQRLLFIALVMFTDQRAGVISSIMPCDITKSQGKLTISLDRGRKMSTRGGKSKYVFGDDWVFLRDSLILWTTSLRRRYYKLIGGKHHEIPLESLPLFFSSCLNRLSNHVISLWLDKTFGTHVTITDLRKALVD